MREIILGCIQGLTEFLPVSSSGHLALVQYFYEGLDDQDILLNILLHLGTLFVVFIYYRQDIITICRAAYSYIQRSQPEKQIKEDKHESEEHRQFLLNRKMLPLIIVGSIPTAIIGVTLKSIIEQSFSSLPIVGGALVITGTALYLANMLHFSNSKQTISYLDALIIGTVQGIAIFPGISRSGSTISAGILLGIESKTAAKYSFLLSVPAILGAVVLEGNDLVTLTQTAHLMPYLLGTLIAFVTGFFAITALIKVVVKRKLSWFSFYCWGLGGIALLYGLAM